MVFADTVYPRVFFFIIIIAGVKVFTSSTVYLVLVPDTSHSLYMKF